MSSNRERRVNKELHDMYEDRSNSGVLAELANGSNMTHLKGTLAGPPDTPYAGGKFIVDIKIPDDYPFKPPKIEFETRVWHPNISSQTGAICLDTLGTGWSPVQTIKTALISLRALLEKPNAEDPQDAVVAKMMKDEPEKFAMKAHEWAVKHAGAPAQSKVNADQYKSIAPKNEDGNNVEQYHGYHPSLVTPFLGMEFRIEEIIPAFNHFEIDQRLDSLEEAHMGDIAMYMFEKRGLFGLGSG